MNITFKMFTSAYYFYYFLILLKAMYNNNSLAHIFAHFLCFFIVNLNSCLYVVALLTVGYKKASNLRVHMLNLFLSYVLGEHAAVLRVTQISHPIMGRNIC